MYRIFRRMRNLVESLSGESNQDIENVQILKNQPSLMESNNMQNYSEPVQPLSVNNSMITDGLSKLNTNSIQNKSIETRKRWECNKCGLVLKTRDLLREHRKLMHNANNGMKNFSIHQMDENFAKNETSKRMSCNN